jgi:hypothetical protein
MVSSLQGKICRVSIFLTIDCQRSDPLNIAPYRRYPECFKEQQMTGLISIDMTHAQIKLPSAYSQKTTGKKDDC